MNKCTGIECTYQSGIERHDGVNTGNANLSIGYQNGNDYVCVYSSSHTSEAGFDASRNLLYNKGQDKPRTLQNTGRKAEPMSFAGIIFHPQTKKIIGFADRKSSLPLYNYTIEHPARNEITKIFKKKDFIITFVGTNTFLLAGEKGYKALYLDEWVKDNIDKCQSPYKLIILLRDFLNANCALNQYSIVVQASYLTGDDMPLFISSSISENSFSCTTQLIEGLAVMTSGDESYLNEFKKREKLLHTVDERELEENLQMVCSEFDCLSAYNPVGYGWNIEQIDYAAIRN